ncbi:MAG: DUF6446 family protein [Pseudomonadota bacterium]
MNGKIVGVFLVGSGLIAGAALYYLQLYAFYEPVDSAAPEAEITIIASATGAPEPFILNDFEGIDSDSSPIRYRACFTTPMSLPMLTETYIVYDGAVPLNGPPGLPCFDAREIGETLEREEAVAFLSAKNIVDGVDRVIAVFEDGRAFAWHQLNEKYSE